MQISFLSCSCTSFTYLPSVLSSCWLGSRKGIRSVKNLIGGVLAWLSVWGEVQMCISPSWCHCHSLSLAPVNPDWFYQNGSAFLVPAYPGCPEKRPLNERSSSNCAHTLLSETCPLFIRYFNDRLSILCEFVPQTIFLLSIFGYLILLIVYKWIGIDASISSCAPSLLIRELPALTYSCYSAAFSVLTLLFLASGRASDPQK